VSATSFIDRAALLKKGAPLQKERRGGGIDSIGGPTLVNARSQRFSGGAIAACGLARSADLLGSILPFILRGVTLIGIESAGRLGRSLQAIWMQES
jgi:acrylyl-CoA reductase (NADPH)